MAAEPRPCTSNPCSLAEAHDVPDDQEIPGQIQLFDHGQLALDLALGFFVIGTVALARARIGQLAQIRIHGFAGRHGICRKLVAQIAQRELQAGREILRVGDGLGQIGEQFLHLRGALEWRSAFFASSLAGFENGRFVVDAGEGVEQIALVFEGVRDAVGGEQRQLQFAGDGDGGLVAMLLGAIVVALEFDEDVVTAENLRQAATVLLDDLRSSGEADQPGRVFGDIFQRSPPRFPDRHARYAA